MNGILVVNHFLRGEKYENLHRHLQKSAAALDIELEIKTNLQLATQKAQGDFVLFWDKDINLARRIEKGRTPVFNSADAIEKCDDKARTYIELDGIVLQPETLIAPKCYQKSDMTEFAERATEILGLPLVFKECFGSFGEQVHLCRSVGDILSHAGEKSFVLQKFIAESAGRDKRIEVIGGKCVCGARRTNENDFRSNVTNGGTMQACAVSKSEEQTAITACNALGLTFGGVDILDDGSVCEVNSNAHIINIMNATGIDIAPLIFSEIAGQIK